MMHDMMVHGNSLLCAEHTCLYTVVGNNTDKMTVPFSKRQDVEKGFFLYGRCTDAATDVSQTQHTRSHIPIGKGTLSRTVLSGKTVIINE